MAYATVADVKARAGTLNAAWGEDTDPGDGDLSRFVNQTSDNLDAAIAGLGYPVPIDDPVASRALVSPNADMALLLAIDATWPGQTGDVQDLRAEVATRVEAYWQAIRDKNLPALMALAAGSAGAQEGGASNYWTQDAMTYEYWDWWASLVGWEGRWYPAYPDGVPFRQGPEFARGMRL